MTETRGESSISEKGVQMYKGGFNLLILPQFSETIWSQRGFKPTP